MKNAVRRIICPALAVALGAAGPLALSVAAHAEAGQITWTTYLYAGPGQRYKVIDEVQQAQKIEIQDCTGGWCQVTFGDRAGFVLAETVVHAGQDAAHPPAGILAQPAASLEPDPKGPCFTANQKGGNGGNEPSEFCQR